MRWPTHWQVIKLKAIAYAVAFFLPDILRDMAYKLLRFSPIHAMDIAGQVHLERFLGRGLSRLLEG